MYNLLRLEVVSLVCITQDEAAVSPLEDRVQSRLNALRVAFPPYSTVELEAILKHRARHSLHPKGLTTSHVRQMAIVSDGDARVALHLLRSAVNRAAFDGRSQVRPDDVKTPIGDLQTGRRERALRALSPDHRTLANILAKHDELTSGTLFQEYVHQCAEMRRRPVAPRTFSNYCNRLVQAGLATREPAREKGRQRLLRSVR